MARICIQSKWYEQVEPSTFSEGVFEDRVTLHAPTVYPFFYVVPFKKAVHTPDDSSDSGYSLVVPDLAFISKDYTEWWVGEVEMGYHSFNDHVKPQIEKLIRADYSDECVEYLCKKDSKLDRDKFSRLVRNNPTRVLVIVNQDRPDWILQWKKDSVVFAVFELYRSADGDELFLVNGEYPSVLTDRISNCSFHPLIKRFLHVDEPDKLKLQRDVTVKILYNNCLTEWKRVDEGGQVWLTAVNRDPLNTKCTYSIYRQNDGQLVLIGK